eukprot:c10053_g1_i6.p1 GENE.c10053_g1_i6~~c10053_g1_i6.p1  ORF type:complete len:119 (+),score=22.68 c10053_g1_i6:94-450(+)
MQQNDEFVHVVEDSNSLRTFDHIPPKHTRKGVHPSERERAHEELNLSQMTYRIPQNDTQTAAHPREFDDVQSNDSFVCIVSHNRHKQIFALLTCLVMSSDIPRSVRKLSRHSMKWWCG